MRPPIKVTPLYHRVLEALQPGDHLAVISIEETLQRSMEAAIQLPEFLDFNPENILLFILRNMASQTQAGHIEYIIRALLDQIHEAFLHMAYPVDPVVVGTAMSIVTFMIDQLSTMITRLGLFSPEGLFFYKPAIINKYEVVMYDTRLRPDASSRPTTVGGIHLR